MVKHTASYMCLCLICYPLCLQTLTNWLGKTLFRVERMTVLPGDFQDHPYRLFRMLQGLFYVCFFTFLFFMYLFCQYYLVPTEFLACGMHKGHNSKIQDLIPGLRQISLSLKDGSLSVPSISFPVQQRSALTSYQASFSYACYILK